MGITVTPPTADHRIVTDMAALGHAIDLTGRINALTTPNGATEAEVAATRRERDRLADQLRDAAQQVDASTITLTLHGLRSNAWNQIVTEHTRLGDDGRQERDLAAMLRQAVPAMLDTAADADGTPLKLNGKDLAGLLDSLTDSQTLDLWRTVQGLNTPATGLPKETLTLLASLA